MSEQEQELEQGQEAEQQQEQETEKGQEQEAKYTLEDWQKDQEAQARETGWKPFEEYVAEGGDPKRWRTAEMYNERGELHKVMRARDAEIDQQVQQRLSGVKKIYEGQIKLLKEERDKLLDEGDAAGVRRLDKQIDTLQQDSREHAQTAPKVDHALQEWNAKNAAWINDADDPKAVYAHAQWQMLAQKHQGNTVAALAELERKLASKFPPPAKPRGHVPGAETGKHKGFQKNARALSWDDLTSEERQVYERLPSAWKSKDQFIKAAQDARNAEEEAK